MSERTYEASYVSWGNTDGHNPTSDNSFDPYSFGSSNNTEPYVSSEGAHIAYPGIWDLEQDIARLILGRPWRIPSTNDYSELLANCDFINPNGTVIDESQADKRVDIADESGEGTISVVILRSKINGERIIFQTAGYGSGMSLVEVGVNGHYWTRNLGAEAQGRNFVIRANGTNIGGYDYRYIGMIIRPVW